MLDSDVSDFELCRHATSGNQALAVALSQWVFKEKGVLRAQNIKHYKKGEKNAPDAYTVMDDVVSLSLLSFTSVFKFVFLTRVPYILNLYYC